jgi:hypothetical protein
MLMFPEGDHSHRRHAHTDCVLAARRAGKLPTREEWLKSRPREPGPMRRLVNRVVGRRANL